MTREEAIERFRKDVDKQLKWTDFSFDFEMLLHSVYDDFENRTCKNCRYYGCMDENIYSDNVCSQYQKVFINKRDGTHFLKCIKEPHSSCDLWECKDDS